MMGAVVMAALALAGAGAAEPSAPAATPAPPAVVSGASVEGAVLAKPVAEEDPVVCRSEIPIGSKLPVKVCVRKSDRDRQKRDSQEALQLIQRRSDGPVKLDERLR